MKKKNGIEKRRFTNESKKENSNAPILNNTFFCVIAANAERKADSSAIANQVKWFPL
jgi:hypothetical protein